MIEAVEALKTGDGGYAGEPGASASTNAVVGGILLSLGRGREVSARSVDWLTRRLHPGGGFVAAPGIPIPDLVSTATAVFALHAAGADLGNVREPCRGFVEGLWDEEGGFCGHWLDDQADCEHTFHGLLTIGCLQEES
jgi:hypothetical protein